MAWRRARRQKRQRGIAFRIARALRCKIVTLAARIGSQAAWRRMGDTSGAQQNVCGGS
jgi:hypothetical protein